jgi:PAS domain S-box-containing protein
MGSLLQVTGVCDVQADDSRRPRAFRLTVPGSGAIQLLEAPPLFGLGHAVGGVTLVALLALIWSWQLRRKLERQQRQAAERERAEREIRELNAGLEKRVADRTAELARVAALASASEARTRSVVDTALDAVISMDTAGRITGWNARAEAIFGWPAAEVLGRSLAETIIPLSLREAHRRGLERYLATGEGPALNRLLEVTALRRDGQEFPAELSFAALQIDGAEHFSGFLRDITDRKRVETELLQNYAREKELSELKSRFVSMVSHEFRTPLGIIASSAEILDAYLDRLSNDERKSNLQDITDATRHMSRMMEQVLLLGRVEAGKLACRVGPLDLAVFCQRLVEEVNSQTGSRCPIHFTAAPELPGAQADEGLLRHIFTNLLSNACKYSPPGRVVEFQVQSRGPLALFTVRDRGIGIPEGDMRLLFQAFHRGRNVGDIPGTGLGMVIVKHCVQLHGGKIAFESKEGQGTSFVVALPLFSGAGEDGHGATQLFHKVATDQNLTLVL